MSWHTFLQQIHLMTFRAFHSDAKTLYMTIGVLLFTLVFLVVGLSRWVEFMDFQFSSVRRTTLISFHVVGCLAFASAFALFAIDFERTFAVLIMSLLASSLVLLFPIHIYLGLLRRKHQRQKILK